MIRIVICDDQEEDRNEAGILVRESARKERVEIRLDFVENGTALLEYLGEREADLILLDIELPGESGTKLAAQVERLAPEARILFVTNMESMVFEAVSRHPFGFVRKRRIQKELPDNLKDYFRKYEKEQKQLVLETEDGMLRWRAGELWYIECFGHTLTLHRSDGRKLEIRKRTRTMGELEEELRDAGFIRIHKGYLVNVQAVSAIGKDWVRLPDGKQLNMSRRRAAEANAGTDSWELRILFLLMSNFLFFLCTRLILRGRRKGRLNRSEVVLLLAMTALTLICGGIAYQDIMEKRGTYLHGLFIIGMIIFTVTLYVFFMRMHLFREKEMEAERFRIQVQEQSVLIDQVRKQYEETVKLRHDLKHYVFQMEDLLERGQVEELSVYLGNFLDQKVGRIRQYLESGSAILDAVINTKLSQAAERGIEVQTAVSGRMEEGEADRELGIILANLLDNAAEACQKQEVSWIFLRAELNRNQWYFSIENSILPEMELSLLTTKKEPEYHGYGLKSAKSLTEKMGGILQMRRKEESFQVKVMISREM